MALASASASAVRRLKRTRRGESSGGGAPPLAWNWSAINSTAGPTYPRSLGDRKSTRLNSSHTVISYAVFCLKKKRTQRLARHKVFPKQAGTLLHDRTAR